MFLLLACEVSREGRREAGRRETRDHGVRLRAGEQLITCRYLYS